MRKHSAKCEIEKETAVVSERSIVLQIFLSFVSTILCLVALCSATLAYLQLDRNSGESWISAAGFSLEVQSDEGSVIDGAYLCEGEEVQTYAFTLRATGMAERGYCKVFFDGDTENAYITRPIKQDEDLILFVQAAKGTEILFEACWGISSASAMGEITYGEEEILVYTER